MVKISIAATLTALLLSVRPAATINANIKRLTLIPGDSTKVLNWNIGGAATGSTAVWPAGGASISVNATVAATLYFYTVSPWTWTVLQEG